MKLAGRSCLVEMPSYTGDSYILQVDTFRDIWAGFVQSECCRQYGHFDTANKFIDRIAASELAQSDDAIKAAISRHREKLSTRDTSPLPDDLITQSPPKWPTAIVRTTPVAIVPPNWISQGFSFAKAITNWAAGGFKTCTEIEINERLAICRACPELVNEHCQKCGCACVEANRLINKLALATEKCPLGKWESVTKGSENRVSLNHKKANFCYFTGTNRAEDMPLVKMLLRSARSAGVAEDFHLFAPWPSDGYELHEIPQKTPWRNHLAKVDFLRQLADTSYEYCVWLDTDNYFVRHPGDLTKLLRDNLCWVSMEGNLTSTEMRWADWWTMRKDATPNLVEIMRAHGCGNEVRSTNGGMWIVKTAAITKFADKMEQLSASLHRTHPGVSDEPPLAIIGQTWVDDWRMNTVEELSDVWACDWVGRYRDKLPDGQPWLYEDWMTGKKLFINPAIIHSMRGKDTVRSFLDTESGR